MADPLLAFKNVRAGYGDAVVLDDLAFDMPDGGSLALLGRKPRARAAFMGGVDFRLSPAFGIGPFLDFSAGKYTTYRAELPGYPTQEGDVPTPGTHEWLAFGVRGTFFP